MSIHNEQTAPVTFVNTVVSGGYLNGVANFAFSTYRWLPIVVEEEGQTQMKVEAKPYISANLRMDLYAVKALRDECNRILDANTKPATPEQVN